MTHLAQKQLTYDPFGTETTYFWMLFLWQMGHKLPWETPKYLPVLLAAGFTTPYPCMSFVPKHPTSICRLAVVGSNKFPPSALGSCNTGEGGYGKDKISFSGKCKYLWWTTWSRPSIKKNQDRIAFRQVCGREWSCKLIHSLQSIFSTQFDSVPWCTIDTSLCNALGSYG